MVVSPGNSGIYLLTNSWRGMARDVALLRHIVDYAGMFPPAALPFDAAVSRYAAYLQGDDAWMLGRLVCPAARLHELLTLSRNFGGQASCRLSVLLASGARGDAFYDGIEADFDQALAFQDEAPDTYVIEAFEMPMPPTSVRHPGAHIESWIGQIAARIGRTWSEDVLAFVEPPISAVRPDEMEELLAGLHAASSSTHRVRLAAKVRCGGTDASSVPPSDTLARFLWAAREVGIAWKATAGLHQPFRGRMPGSADPAHGFVNVFTAGALVHGGKVSLADVETILADEDAGHFSVGSSDISWQGIQASAQEVDAARAEFALSFGSCSFDEPVEGLRQLGILDELAV